MSTGMDLCDCRAALKKAMTGERAEPYVTALQQHLAAEMARNDDGAAAQKNAAGSTGAGHRAGTAKANNLVRALAACRRCPNTGVQGGARAFLEAPPMSIVLCSNRLHSPAEVEDALVHELVHAYDMGPAQRDLTDCDELAASEVRAAREAECSQLMRTMHAAVWPRATEWLVHRCCRDTATTATCAMFPEEGATSVERVFDRAMLDHSPRTIALGSSSSGAANDRR